MNRRDWVPGCQLTARTGVREEKDLQARMLGRSMEPAPGIRRPELGVRVGRVALGSGLGSQGLWPTGDQGSGGRSPGSSTAQSTVHRFHGCSNKGRKLSSQINTRLLPSCFGGQKSPVGLPGLQSRCGQGCVPSGGSRGGWDRSRAVVSLISLLCPSLPT